MTSEHNSPTFAGLGLPAPLLKSLDRLGYETPSPIQAAGIPVLLDGRDMIGQAQTGTGKTAAFALPILARIQVASQLPQAIVLTPTRELAIQVAEAFQSYARHLKDFHVLPIYGGQDMRTQLRLLKRGAQIVVGTPGRVLDHLRRGSLVLSDIRYLVLDEADEMLRMGFIEDVETILSHTGGQQQTALFSATLPPPIRKVAQRFLRDPEHIHIKGQQVTVDTVAQFYWMINHRQKMDALTRLLESEDAEATIIFVRTRETTTQLAEKVAARGHRCAAINGDMSQAQREKTIRQLKEGQIDILIATDVAARGLDVERISLVVNFDIPHDSEAYVHRIGRTGRAGRQGRAILLVTPREQHLLRSIERATGQSIAPLALPTHEELTSQRIERFKQQIAEAAGETPNKNFFAQIANELSQEYGLSEASLATTLIYLLQKERPLQLPKDGLDSSPEAKKPRKARQADDSRGKEEGAGARTKSKAKRGREEKVAFDLYRIEVGRAQGATPSDIVGAIANEAGLESRYIGQISLDEDHSTVELPSGMPDQVFKHLKQVWVRNKKLDISRCDRPGGERVNRKSGKARQEKPSKRRR